jgi:uncharacterized protein YjbJ (UPF0337 family)
MNTQEIRGQWNTLKGKVKEKWGQLTDDDLRMAEGNVDQLIGRIQQRTGEARRNIEQYLDELLEGSSSMLGRVGETVTQAAQQAGERVQEGYEYVRDQANEGYRRAGEMVEHRPMQSMAAVFGIGMVTGVVVGLLLCDRD